MIGKIWATLPDDAKTAIVEALIEALQTVEEPVPSQNKPNGASTSDLEASTHVPPLPDGLKCVQEASDALAVEMQRGRE